MAFNPRWTISASTSVPPETATRIGIGAFGLFPAFTTVRVAFGDGDVGTFSPNAPFSSYDIGHVYVDAMAPYRVVVTGFESGVLFGREVMYAFIQAQTPMPVLQRGTGIDDLIQGGGGADSLLGLNGDDLLHGAAGNDTLLGGNGDDQLIGGADADLLRGDAGNDTLDGGDAPDTLYGGAGNDVLQGGSGNDRLLGGSGDDVILGDNFFPGETSNDIIYGEDGNDTLIGGAHNDTLYGGAGNDDLRGGPGNDVLYGGTGADYFEASEGRDVLVTEADGDFDFFYWGSPLFNQSVIKGFQSGEDQIRLAFMFETDFFAGNMPLQQAPVGTDIFYDTDDGRLFVLTPGSSVPMLLIRFFGAPTLAEGDFTI